MSKHLTRRGAGFPACQARIRAGLSIVFLFLLCLAPAAAKEITISLLATTDLHGNILPVDYYSEKPVNRGLAKLATLIRAERERNPNSILIDCGDTIQGTPLEFVHQRGAGANRPDPMMLAMNHLGYSAMVLGNHEFNFGLKNLQTARDAAKFPWLSANTAAEAGAKPFEPYIVSTISGVRIAVVGLTTPVIPMWEKPENYRGYRFQDAVETAARVVTRLRQTERPDIVVLAVHAGRAADSQENMVDRLATSVPGIDAIVFGHTHRELAGELVNNVLLVQPKNWGAQLARIDFTLDDGRLVKKTSVLIPATKETVPDPEILALARPYHEAAERYLSAPVAEAPVDMDGRLGRVEDSPLVDAIHEVQLHYAKADVSFASLFHLGVKVPKGRITVRQIAALYVYENQLFAVEGTGRMVKEALENSARYFNGASVNKAIPGFSYDTAQGVEYDLDVTRPEGDRIQNLRYKGQPLRPDQKLRLAVNNYRAAGSGGYGMFRNAPILWRSTEDIRDLIVAYFTERGRLPAKADNNWRIVPPQAQKALESQFQSPAPEVQ